MLSRSSIWDYRPHSRDLSHKRALLKEQKRVVQQLEEEISAMQEEARESVVEEPDLYDENDAAVKARQKAILRMPIQERTFGDLKSSGDERGGSAITVRHNSSMRLKLRSPSQDLNAERTRLTTSLNVQPSRDRRRSCNDEDAARLAAAMRAALDDTSDNSLSDCYSAYRPQKQKKAQATKSSKKEKKRRNMSRNVSPTVSGTSETERKVPLGIPPPFSTANPAPLSGYSASNPSSAPTAHRPRPGPRAVSPHAQGRRVSTSGSSSPTLPPLTSSGYALTESVGTPLNSSGYALQDAGEMTPPTDSEGSGYATAQQPSAMALNVESSDDSDSSDDEWKWEEGGGQSVLMEEDKDEGVTVGQWNIRFQRIISKLRSLSILDESTLQERIQASQELTYLNQDFIHAAKTFGKIIISEVYLPRDKKTIKPINLGGVAGGQKYIVHEILFKFAFDGTGLFKGDNLASAKVGGHELKGLMSYFSLGLTDVNFPMMALVGMDLVEGRSYPYYRGFRLIAMSVLPLQEGSLIYGTNDAGRTMHADDPAFNKIMKSAGKSLNLKSHICGSQRSNLVMLTSPADLEGHKGTDGEYYLLDFSRTLPPVQNDEAIYPGGHLYRLFRKNFVEQYPLPLCSDGLSGFIAHDPENKQHNRDIAVATEYLHHYSIPVFVDRFIEKVLSVDPTAISVDTEMHVHGINLRYLGRVYNVLLGKVLNGKTGAKIASRLVMIEACARVMKNELYKTLQKEMKEQKMVMEVPYRRVVIEKLNLWFAEDPPLDGQEFWDSPLGAVQINLMRLFGFMSFSNFIPSVYPDKAVFKQHWKHMMADKSGAQVKALRKSSQEEKIRKSFLRSVSTMNLESFATKRVDSSRKFPQIAPPPIGRETASAPKPGFPPAPPRQVPLRPSHSVNQVPPKAATASGSASVNLRDRATVQNLGDRVTKGGEFFTSKGCDSRLLLQAKDGSQTVSLKKYLFFDREIGRDGKVIGWWVMFERLAQLIGLVFTDDIMRRFKDETETLRVHPNEPLSLHDLVQMEGRVKSMNIVCAAVGDFFQFKGVVQSQKEFAADHYCRAIEKYEEALADVPNDKTVLFNCAVTHFKLLMELHHTATGHVRLDEQDHVVKVTKEYFEATIAADPTNYLAKCIYAQFLEECGKLKDAENNLLSALEVEPNFAPGLVEYAQFLVRRGAMAAATAMLKRAKTLKSSCLDPMTGKPIRSIFRVYLSNDTFTAVEASPLATTTEIFEEVGKVLKVKAEKRGATAVCCATRRMKISQLFFMQEDQDGKRYRPLKLDENPWLLPVNRNSHMVCIPVRLPTNNNLCVYDHWMRQLWEIRTTDFTVEENDELSLLIEDERKKFLSQLSSNLRDFLASNFASKPRPIVLQKRVKEGEYILSVLLETVKVAVHIFATVSKHCTHDTQHNSAASGMAQSSLPDALHMKLSISSGITKSKYLPLLENKENKVKTVLADIKSTISFMMHIIDHTLEIHTDILVQLDVAPVCNYLAFWYGVLLNDLQLCDKKLCTKLMSYLN